MDIFLKYNWLVKHSTEINWNKGIIQSTRYPKECKIQYQDILFRSRIKRIIPMEKIDKKYQEIEKEPDPTNPEDLPEYI